MTIDIENEMKFYKHDTYQFKEPFFSLKPSKIYLGKSRICAMTEMCEARDNHGFAGNTFLLDDSLETNNNEYIFISGFEIIIFTTEDKIMDFISNMGSNMIPYSMARGGKKTHIFCLIITNISKKKKSKKGLY